MKIGGFRNRSALLDERSDEFLRLLLALGGYCTASQAKQLGIAGSGTRTRARLRHLEEAGFLRKVSAYPVIYQITRSTTRMLGRDSSARRRHTLATVQARLLAVDFYLEACRWPAEFVFEHEKKIAMFTDGGCSLSSLPQRGGKPYLWEEFVLSLSNGRIGVAIVDQPCPSAFSQMLSFAQRFTSVLRYMGEELELLIVTGDRHRDQLYGRLLRHPRLRKHWPDHLAITIKRYCVGQPMASASALLWPSAGRQQEIHNLSHSVVAPAVVLRPNDGINPL